jgi:hypothetical protein
MTEEFIVKCLSEADPANLEKYLLLEPTLVYAALNSHGWTYINETVPKSKSNEQKHFLLKSLNSILTRILASDFNEFGTKFATDLLSSLQKWSSDISCT